MHTAASCCLEQTSTVLTVNRPGNTIPSSVPFSCWRAHTVLSLLSPLAQLNWSSPYHHLVLPIYNTFLMPFHEGCLKWKLCLDIILDAAYTLVSFIKILRKNLESKKMAALFRDLDCATTPPQTPPLHFSSEFRHTSLMRWDVIFYNIW